MPPLFAKHPRHLLDDAFSLVEAGANQAATGENALPLPTEAQAHAGNYLMGRVKLHGLPIRIENVRGSYREGTAPDGTQWRTRLAAHYGYFFGTCGADGDAVDVFVGMFPESESVWVVNQRHVGGKSGFDEHKVMLGFHTEQQARDAYTDSFDRSWTGLMSIVPASTGQLKWWLKHGNHKNPFLAEALPYDGENTMLYKVLWDSNAQPTSSPLHRVLYDLRVNDAAGLMLDAMTVQDLMSDPDIEAVPVYDALVVEVASMTRKMALLQSTMDAAGVVVKPLEMTIADPVKARGVLQVMVLFTMSDGQTVSIWFHNPDTTPTKLTPMDELISWKWLINKKDVTIVVAPERGRDLNVREVSRRIMRLVEKNSEAFTKANAKAGERAAVTEALKTEIAALEGTLSGLQRQIDVAKVSKEGADEQIRTKLQGLILDQSKLVDLIDKEKVLVKAGGESDLLKSLMDNHDDLADEIRVLRGEAVEGRTGWDVWQELRAAEALRNAPDIDPTTPEGYARVQDDEALQIKYQDVLDTFFEGRLVDVRNNLRDLGWGGEQSGPLSKSGVTLEPKFKYIGAGQNIVGMHYELGGVGGFFMSDTLVLTPVELAGRIDLGLPRAAEPAPDPVSAIVPESEALAASDPVVIVDAAYPFASATDAFKEWIADSVQDEDYSPFATAKAMDAKANELGANIAWDVSTAVLDSASEAEEGDDFDESAEWDATPEEDAGEPVMDGDFSGHPFRGNQFKAAGRASGAAVNSSIRAKTSERRGDAKSASKAHETAHYAHKAAAVEATGKAKKYHKVMAKFHGARAGMKLDAIGSGSGDISLGDAAPLFDWMLDDAGETYETAIGVISANGGTAGRAHIGGDGKAMVFVGTEGLTRVLFEDGTRAAWSDDDAADMVEVLLAKPKDIEVPPVVPEAQVPAETDVSRLNAADRAVSKESILSDDPQAIEKLDAKLTALRMRQEFMKKANKLFKSGDDAGLLAMGLSQFQIDSLKKPDFAGRTGFADYLLSNNNGVIGTTRKRLESMIAARMKSDAAEIEPTPVVIEPVDAHELVVTEGRDPRDVSTDPEGLLIVDPIKNIDTAYLSTMIDGTADMFSADILERLEPMFTRYENNVAMMDLLNQAAQAYSDAAVKAAQAALATA